MSAGAAGALEEQLRLVATVLERDYRDTFEREGLSLAEIAAVLERDYHAWAARVRAIARQVGEMERHQAALDVEAHRLALALVPSKVFSNVAVAPAVAGGPS